MEETAIFEPIIDGILSEGYGVVDGFLSAGEVEALARQLRERRAEGRFKAAAIGNQQITVEKQIRGDEIHWLDETVATPAEKVYLDRINEFIQYVNRTCYLGLQDAELHYALYPPGTFYKRHLDRFKTDSRRKLSVICYLNHNWQEADGGQLAIYLPNADGTERIDTVLPVGGRLVCFESDRLEHEVLPANRERLSVTGWLRTR
ncbi:2OG-Fe(II) oxygenase [Arsenicibacter rosenii]|uniref:Oxidoreductase n=1 Tax=Arsenicibacter rosenii TaxID=1750698 RepID=A0A1S2VMZ0_9BACT|nr:2OG-Fe(II) oxygenase [Arsenicibacter rosenii]OIN60142.1 oxidoreductase [Arsenicibacter rosenii]